MPNPEYADTPDRTAPTSEARPSSGTVPTIPAPAEAAADPIKRLQAVEVRSAELEVYEALRYEIIHGLPPGTPLRLAQLAERFNVSTMPVRAAITRLQAEGMVVQQPRRGAVVTELTTEDFVDIYAIRMALEGVAAYYGCTNLTDEDLDRMRACYRGMVRLPQGGDTIIDQYLPLDWQLHDICYDASGRSKLVRLIHLHRRQAERYFRVYLCERADLSDDIEQQGVFLRACEAREPDAAEAAIRELFDRTTRRLVPALTEAESR